MIKIPFYIILIVSTFFYACTESKSSSINPPFQLLHSPFFQSFEDSLKAKIETEKIPALAVVVVKDTSVIYQNVLGVKDSLNVNTVFRIASLSKGFSAVLAGIMVEKQLLNWDDKIVDLYPGFALKDSVQTQKITVRHLLSHSTGLPRHAFTNLIEEDISLDVIIPMLAGLNLIGREGEFYAYQNAAFAIIEKILESKSKMSFTALLKSRIFEPAHMSDASASYSELIENKNIAIPCRFDSKKNEYVPVKLSREYYNTVSAGGINCSVNDMGKWIQVLLGNHPEIISRATLDTIFSPLIKVNTRLYSHRWGVRRSSYAMGWRVLVYNDRSIVFHGGFVNGYRSEIAVDQKNRIGICILANSSNDLISQIIPDFFSNLQKDDSVNISTLLNKKVLPD